MSKKTRTTIVFVVLLIVVLIGWCLSQQRRYDDPADFATMPVSKEGTDDWKEYHDEHFGFDMKYPQDYFLCPKQATDTTSCSEFLSLRQDTTSAEECRTSGKRIGLHIWRLGCVVGCRLAGCSIKLTKDTTVADIEQQFLAEDIKDRRPAVRRTCHRREINGNNSIVCTLRAPGEAAELTGGIFEVYVLGVYEMGDGGRVLLQMDNCAGGTPHGRDRTLRRDVLRVFHTLRWTSSETQ